MAEKKKHKVVRSWVDRHVKDHYVHLASKDGYRSRAAYKLLEIDKRFFIFKQAHCVVDLGSAPGSWLQVVKHKIGTKSSIIGVDLLEVPPISSTTVIQGDFTSDETLLQLESLIDGKIVDLVLSDMAPNLSGIKVVDQSRCSNLVESVLLFADDQLKLGGDCVIKVFYGGEFNKLVNLAKAMFTKVDIYKPQASRGESSEAYLVCKTKKG